MTDTHQHHLSSSPLGDIHHHGSSQKNSHLSAQSVVCYLCGVEDHSYVQCINFTGKELAVYCETDSSIHIMRHYSWPTAVMRDLFMFLESTTKTAAIHFDVYLSNQSLITKEPTIRCQDVHIAPGALIYALARKSCPPQIACPGVKTAINSLLFEEARALRLLKGVQSMYEKTEQQSLHNESDTMSAVGAGTSRMTQSPADISQGLGSSYGVTLPSGSHVLRLERETAGRQWADLTDSVGSHAFGRDDGWAATCHPDVSIAKHSPPAKRNTPVKFGTDAKVITPLPVGTPTAGDSYTVSEGEATSTSSGRHRRQHHRRAKKPAEKESPDETPAQKKDAVPVELTSPTPTEAAPPKTASKPKTPAKAPSPKEKSPPATTPPAKKRDANFKQGARRAMEKGSPQAPEPLSTEQIKQLIDRTIHVKFLPNDVDPQWLMTKLSEAGTVLKVRLCDPGEKFRICFVEYDSPVAAEKMIHAMSGTRISNTLRLAVSHPNAPITVVHATDAVVGKGGRPCTFGRSGSSTTSSPEKGTSPHTGQVSPPSAVSIDAVSTPSPVPGKSFAQVAKGAARAPGGKQGTEAVVSKPGESAKKYKAPASSSPSPPEASSPNVENPLNVSRQDVLEERLSVVKTKRRDVRESPASSEADNFDANIAVAERAAQLYVWNATSTAFHTAENAAINAYTFAGQDFHDQLRAKVLLVALYVHHGSFDNAIKYAYSVFGSQAAANTVVTPSTLNLLITIALLLEKHEPMLAAEGYRKTQAKANSSKIPTPLPQIAVPLLPTVLPGIADLPTAVLSGSTTLRLF